MKQTLILLGLAASLALILPERIAAQNPADALHAPDGNSYSRIVSIFIAPMTNAPFSATVNTEWARQTGDGAAVTVKNHRLVARDSQGRIFEERRRFVPADSDSPSLVFQIEFSDPVRHTKYICFPANKVCDLYSYSAPLSQPTQPVGPIGDGKRYLSRGDLGKGEMSGIETIGTRETISTNPGVVGNDREVSLTKEFWYSPKLGVNLMVKRMDPLQGTQVFTVTDISLSEPDARVFVVPANYRVKDQRDAPPAPAR
jgi:hypothetical protein